jgi:hypothetical protein
MTHLVVLDCEAIQALRDPGHPKHHRVVSQAQVVANRKRRAVAIQMVVPAAVRVEVGWDRTSPAWVLPNRLRIADSPLDTASANTAAGIRDRTGVPVADSHMGRRHPVSAPQPDHRRDQRPRRYATGGRRQEHHRCRHLNPATVIRTCRRTGTPNPGSVSGRAD